MAEKPKTLTELIEAIIPITTGDINEADDDELTWLAVQGVQKLQELTIATAKAVQELWEHQHQVTTQAVLGGRPHVTNSTKPIGYGSKR